MAIPNADVDVVCMKQDCKFNKDAKCCAAGIVIGQALECQTYEPDASAMMGALAMAAGGPAPAPAAPRPTAAPAGTPPGAGLLGLLAGRGGAPRR